MRISKHHTVFIIVIILLGINYIFLRNDALFWKLNALIIFIYTIILYIGVTRHRLNYFVNSVNSGTKKGISLTFDDGPNIEYTAKVLDILKTKNVKATFFVIAKNIEGNEALMQRIVNEGHIIGNHSYHHYNWFNMKFPSRIVEEIDQANEVIFNVINKKPKYFRTPFGLTNPNIAKALKRTKYLSIGWDFRSFDTMAKDSQTLLKKLKKHAKDSSIVLLHDNNKITTEALETFIDFCIENGINIVSLDEMISEEAYLN